VVRRRGRGKSEEVTSACGLRLIVALALLGILVSCEKETAGEAPLAGPAYADADSAYTAYNNKDYPAAEAKTREAIALRPDVVRLHLLLIDALVAEEKLDEADAAASQALSRFKDDPALLEAQRRVRDQIVYKKKAEALNVAEQGFKEYDEKDYTGAVRDAHRAIELDPLKSSYRVLLVNALIATEDFDEANREVSEGLTKISDDPDLLDRRRAIGEQIAAKEAARIATQAFEAAEAAYKAFAQRDYATAVKEAQEAVNLEPSNSSYRELLEKSEKALKHPVARETVAERYARQGYAASARGDQAQASEDFKSALQRRLPTRIQTRNVQIALADAQLGDGKPQSALDTLEPFGDAAVYDVAVRRGAALQALKRSPEALESFSTAYNTARTPDERASSLSSEVVLLADLGKKNEARARFDQALASGELQTLPPAQIASLALTVGNGEVAAQYYALTRDTGQLKGRAALDAGYVAMHRAHDKEAIDYFQRAIDAHRAGQLALDPQEVFAIRRQVADLSRTWGAIASLTYSKAGAGPGAPFIPTAGNSLQPGVELYWRPFGYLDGHYIDIFSGPSKRHTHRMAHRELRPRRVLSDCG